MEDALAKIVFTVLGVLLSLLCGLCLYLVRQAGSALKELRQGITELSTKAAVAEERHTHLSGSLSSLHTSVSRTAKDVGKLSGAVDKLWSSLQSAKLIERRLSDELTGTED